MHDEGQVQHVIDRTDWPPGPWDNEPEDRWEGRHAGFPILAVRNHMGAWCGYVGVPPGHPWHRRNYNNLELRAHGGLTYGNSCSGPICHVPAPGEPDAVWWLGFDCMHLYDLVPGMMKFHQPGDHHAGEVYRSLAYVQEQTRAMADQAAAAAAE